MVHLGWSTVPALTLGMLVPGLVTFVLGLVVQRLSGLYLGMATIAFTLIISVLAVNGGDLTGGASGIFGVLGDITMIELVLVVAVVVALSQVSESGGLGRRVDAVRQDPELANAMGINVGRYRRATFLFSGLIGGLAGGITTLLRSTITPDNVTFQLAVLALTVIVVGGTRSWVGVLIGSIIFVWLPTLLAFVAEWQQFIYGVIVALAAIFLPEGLLGLARDRWYRLRTRSVRSQLAAAAQSSSGQPATGRLSAKAVES
jgi:branched-chain amino acid transport system permease protein